MKGLLLKDAYQIWHYAKGVIVATVVMMGAGVVTIMNGANFFIVYAGFLMGMMPMTLLAYDQASKFSEYSAALPVTKEQLVALDAQVYGKRVTPYGAEALVRRDALPAGAELTPVSIEELFVLMVKEECTE